MQDPASTALFEQLRPRLHAISSRIVGSRAEAEDVVQDCFIKWRSADQAAIASPAAWLTTIVQHQSIDRLRRRAREALALQALPEAASDLSPEQALIRRAEVGEALARMLACLSPAERQTLILHEVFERQHADIAAALGIKAVTGRQHLARARRRLRERESGLDPAEKLSRELIRQFQAAIHGMDVPAMIHLLGEEQPMSVLASLSRGPSANEACYRLAACA